jgi:predicted acylesterase/phospholipase RssA
MGDDDPGRHGPASNERRVGSGEPERVACVISGPNDVRVGIVLSGGGLRGAAHLGVLRRIVRHDIPINVMVGVSAGAIIAAYYAAVGLSVHEMIGEAPVFRGRHLIMHGLALRVHAALRPYLRRFCGIIPERLAQLERASFETLHHGVERLGIVCHDLVSDKPLYFSTAEHMGLPLADVAKASAAVPGVFPTKTMTIGGARVRLVDGGVGDSLPVRFARSPALGATHLIVSDCRFMAGSPPAGNDSLVYLRPDLDGIQPLHAPRTALMKAVWRGEAAVTPEVVEHLRSWCAEPFAMAAPSHMIPFDLPDGSDRSDEHDPLTP